MESISMQEVTDFGAETIPGMIELDTLGDDLGMGLLMNNKSIGGSNSGGREVSFGMSGPRDVEVGVRMSSEPETISFDIPTSMNEPHINIQRESGTTFQVGSDFSSGSGLFANDQTSSASGVNFTPASLQKSVSEEERKKKREVLTKLNRLAERGYEVSKHFTMDNSIEEMNEEYERLCDAKRFTSSLEWQRGALVTLVNGLEMMNERYDPFDVKLKGWSESVNESIESYDDIFEELYDKYKGRGGMPPEVRLAFKLATSGFMIHASNSIFNKKKQDIEESLRRDPVFMQRVAQATMGSMGQGFNSFVNEAGGLQMPPPGPTGYPGQSDFFQQSPQAPQSYVAQNPPVARREMRGPPNVDDILQQFESRNSDVLGQPSVASVAEIQSLASEEIHSQAETIKTAGGTRRKKKASTPIGSVYSLNV
jgi:hypothetical protein